MVKEYVAKLAVQLGIQLSSVSVIEGRKLGCNDAHLLQLIADGNLINLLLYQSELDELQSNFVGDRLEQRIRTALLRMQYLLEN